MGIRENLEDIRARVCLAAQRAGRAPEEVQLVAVSKFQPAQAVEEAWRAGQRLFGENYAQELRDKASALGHLDGLRFHFIGRLQANKAKYVAAAADQIESLDDLDVAAELDRRARGLNRSLEALVEVNFDEAQKGGVAEARLSDFLDRLQPLTALRAVGLMAIPPTVAAPEDVRPFFRRLRSLADRHGLSVVSMGMSADFEVAIEEGATQVRVGTAIFGARPPRGG